MKIVNKVILNEVVLDQDIESNYIDASFMLNCSIQAVVGTGSATGILLLEASNDHSESGTIGFTPTNWSAVPNAEIDITTTGIYLIPMVDVSYQWLRVVYEDGSSGSGDAIMTATFVSKGF